MKHVEMSLVFSSFSCSLASLCHWSGLERTINGGYPFFTVGSVMDKSPCTVYNLFLSHTILTS